MNDLSNENIIHVHKDGIEYIQFRRLLEFSDKVQHCYTLKDINLRNKTKDDDDYKKICKALNLNSKDIVSPTQKHTNIVEIVEENNVSSDYPEVDGLLTNKKNKVLSLVFADCTSLFLYDPVKNVIGDIHSGWRGTVNKIGAVAIKRMVNDFKCNPEDIICCIGPTIRQCHFQVEDDVKSMFENTFHDELIIKKGESINGKQKYYVDSVKANIEMLKECGLKEENIIDSGICTVCNNEILHSHRCERDLAGRNGAIISLI